MHISDNYLSPSTCAVMTALTIPVFLHSIKKVTKDMPKEKMPMLGVGSAFSFLIMMFNVPLPGGTTGHAVGGTLVALLLGPEAACIAISVALLIQAVIFNDGGILSYGANCFNMAVVIPFVGYGFYSLIKKYIKSTKGENIGIILGSYLAINFAALCAAIEFGIQPLLFKTSTGKPLYCPYSLNASIPAMTGSHLLVAGIVEAAFTFLIYSFIRKVSPGMIYDNEKKNSKPIIGLIFSLILFTPLGLLASGTAWGEWSADQISNSAGFIPSGIKNGFSFRSILPNYSLNGIPKIGGYFLSAIAGVAILIIIFKVISSISKVKINE